MLRDIVLHKFSIAVDFYVQQQYWQVLLSAY